MLSIDEINKKYNIIYINGTRYYEDDLFSGCLLYESTTPYYLKVRDCEIFENSWKQLLIKLFYYLETVCWFEDKVLLSIDVAWSKQKPFSRDYKTNYIRVRNDLFFNCNQTATHAAFLVKYLLNFYYISKNDCYFILKRQPSSEFKEVRLAYINEVKRGFSFYLKYVRQIDDDKISYIVKFIDSINKQLLTKLSAGYDNFYLIDDPLYFYNYRKKVFDFCEKKFVKEIIQRIKECLNMLYDYIRIDKIRKKKQIQSKVFEKENEDILDERLDDELSKLLDLDDVDYYE